MIQVIYKKRNGDLIQRTINGLSPYRVGDVNSYGWTVASIKYQYKGKWYSKSDYDKLVDNAITKDRKIWKIKRKISALYKNLGYLIELMIAMRVFEIITKVGM